MNTVTLSFNTTVRQFSVSKISQQKMTKMSQQK